MVAISRNMVKVYIAAAGTAPSLIAATGNLVAGEIKSYNRSGGEVDVTTDPVFGGFVDKEKPVSQVEIELEVIPRIDANQDRWDAMIYTADTHSVYTMAKSLTAGTVPTDRAILIHAVSGTSNKTWVYNNCTITKFDLEHSADDNATGTIGFKFSPETEAGVSNFMTKATTPASMPAWTSLDSA